MNQNTWNAPTLVKVTVSGGLGTLAQGLSGTIVCVAIKPPSGVALYDLEITDADGFGICGDTGIKGNASIPCSAQGWGVNTFTISNATVDGVYCVKVFYA